jgi:ectoine hydroxylase-related dioxygenase (phytanoyl-CoA dioxygenase family)
MWCAQVKSGTLVVLHGANVHMSYENRSPHSRHAFSLHVAEGAPPQTSVRVAASV